MSDGLLAAIGNTPAARLQHLVDADSADKVAHLAGEGWAANRLELDDQGASVLPLAAASDM